MDLNHLITGVLLILGFIVFGIGVSIPDLTGLSQRVWSVPEKIVWKNPAAYRWANYTIMASAGLTLLGLGFLTISLYEDGSRILAPGGSILFALGVVFWLIYLVFRSTVIIWAAQRFANNSDVPPEYEPLAWWSFALGSTYMLLGYLSISAIGGALLEVRFLASWIGWVSVAFGLIGALSFISGYPRGPVDDEFTGNASIANIPFWIQIMPFIYGIALIVQAFI